MANSLVGTTIGNYEIQRELGRGGMGVVYKAHEQSLQRVVALKVLSPHLAEDPAFVKRFIREARAAAQLDHPNIVTIYAVGETDGTYYIAMQYVKGQNLAQKVREEGQLDVPEAFEIARQVADALAAAHKRGIIHRDIKPENIMIDRTGRALVMDFGLAKLLTTASNLTKDGTRIGTPMYMAPEQIRGKNVDGRVDVYSLGVVLYQLLAGSPPFEADTPFTVMYQVAEVDPQPLADLNASVPQPFIRLVEKMMAKDPDARFNSAEEVAQQIRAVATSPMEAGAHSAPRLDTPVPEPVAPRERRFPHVSRRTMVTVLAAFALLAVLGLVSAGLRGGQPASDAPGIRAAAIPAEGVPSAVPPASVELDGSVFPDPNLETVVREALSKPAGPLGDAELAALTVLNASSRGIRSLAGLERCVNLESLEFGTSGAPETLPNQIEDANPIRALRQLKQLGLQDVQVITHDVLKAIAQMPALEDLHLGRCNLNERAVLELARANGLKRLVLSGNPGLTDKALKALAELPNLAELCVDHNDRLTKEGLLNLARAKTLRQLYLPSRDPGVMNEVLRALAGLPDLEWLMFEGPLDGESIEVMKTMPRLRRLTLFCDDLPPDALEALKTMENLEWILFQVHFGEHFTLEYARDLQRALPNCEIHGVPGLTP